MAKTIVKPSELGAAIAEQLGLYHKNVVAELNVAGERAAKKLVNLTKKSAPKDHGDFARSLSYAAEENQVTGNKKFTWGAKAPQHRLTHLLVHGHATVDGGRVSGDPFLEDALDIVLPEYEKEVEEALKK